MANIESSKTIFKMLYPTVEANLKRNSNALMLEIRKFIDSRSETLTAPGPSKRLYFNDKEREKICKLAGITLADCQKALDECPLKEGWFKLDKPFHIACVLMIHFYQVNKRPKELNMCVLILSLSLYASLHYKWFRYVNENIMSYTINNLSNKFKIKQLGSLMNALIYTVNTAHETYVEDIDSCSDEAIRKYIRDINTRINGFLRNIANEYYENWKAGNYLNTEEDNYDDENFYVTDNNSMVINRIADNISLQLVSQGLNHTHAERAAKMSQVSVVALKNAIIEISNNYDKEINELITNLLQVYLLEGKNPPRSIRSQHFFNQCMMIYLKSNTSDESILRIKFLLDKWLTATSPAYNKTERIATKNNFRRAVYFYFVYRIMTLYN